MERDPYLLPRVDLLYSIKLIVEISIPICLASQYVYYPQYIWLHLMISSISNPPLWMWLAIKACPPLFKATRCSPLTVFLSSSSYLALKLHNRRHEPVHPAMARCIPINCTAALGPIGSNNHMAGTNPCYLLSSPLEHKLCLKSPGVIGQPTGHSASLSGYDRLLLIYYCNDVNIACLCRRRGVFRVGCCVKGRA